MAKATRKGSGAKVPALLLAGALVLGFVLGRATAPQGDSRGGVDAALVNADSSAGEYAEKKLQLDVSPYKGPKDAAVTIYEISDFQCPFCSRVTGTMDRIAQTWPDDVRLVFKHNPLSFHKEARLAAIASLAASRQGHFWKYHDTLFANQKALKRADLVKYAKDLGLDMEKFEADLADGALGRKVDNDQAAAVKLGATGTPAFFVNGVNLSGAKPFEEFKTEIEKQLARAKELTADGVPAGSVSRRLTATSGPKATDFLKFIVDEQAAPKVAAKPPPKKTDETKTVWKVGVDPETEHIKGPKYAPVTIVEFSDFECPFCSKVGPTYKKIAEEYGDKVRVIFKHTPLAFHKKAGLASEAALAAGDQGKFWEMHDLLFDNQKALDRDALEAYAAELGLDMKKFKKTLDDGRHKAKIVADQALSEAVQARGTPNHFINGRKLTGAKPFEDFKVVIDQELEKTGKMLAKGTKLEDLYGVLIKGGKVFNPLDAAVKPIKAGGDSPAKGSAKAAISIVEFSDFECPYCSRVGGPLKKLQAKYPDEISVTFKQFPLSFHKNAQKAAEASLAAHAQGRFWDMHDIMFENQKALQEEKLYAYAAQIGLDMERFKKELSAGTYAAKVKADMAEGQRAGVRGTPSVFIGGRKFSPSGGYTVEGIEKVLAREFNLKVK